MLIRLGIELISDKFNKDGFSLNKTSVEEKFQFN